MILWLNIAFARCMPRLISFALALSSCTARKTSEKVQNEKFMHIVGFDPGTSCLLDRRVIHCVKKPLGLLIFIGKLYLYHAPRGPVKSDRLFYQVSL